MSPNNGETGRALSEFSQSSNTSYKLINFKRLPWLQKTEFSEYLGWNPYRFHIPTDSLSLHPNLIQFAYEATKQMLLNWVQKDGTIEQISQITPTWGASIKAKSVVGYPSFPDRPIILIIKYHFNHTPWLVRTTLYEYFGRNPQIFHLPKDYVCLLPSNLNLQMKEQ